MAKTKISEFSTTAGNNTDINSINIAEGCAPSGINDAIRELMRQLKEFQTGGAGDSVNSGGDFSVATNKFTVASASGNTSVAGTLGVTGAATLSSTLAVTGTTTLTGALVANGNATLGDASGDTVTIKGSPTLEVNPTLSGGTANGVLYLNGSKVATSGSALTFDGSTIKTSGAEPLRMNNDAAFISGYNTAGTTRSGYLQFNASDVSVLATSVNQPLAFFINASEAMRLTGTGLGVGTSSPFGKLQVKTGTNQNLIVSTQGGELSLESANDAYSAGAAIRYYATAHTWFSGANTMRLDSSGNLGLGVTPSAWGSAYKSLEVNGAVIQASSSNKSQAGFGNNYYHNGTNYIYSTSNYATSYFQNSGAHTWYTAASGTAGNAITFTQAMTLDASGNLLVGTTSAQGVGTTIYSPSGVGRIDLNKSASGAATGIGFYYNGTQVGSISYSDTATSFNTSSDYRLKHDIAPMTGALAKVAALKPVTYKWNADGSDGEGFIAHELAEVCHHAVTGEKDAVDENGNPKYQGIDTSFLVATLTAAIKEQQALIEQLTARVAALES